jgi:hypothetical protein
MLLLGTDERLELLKDARVGVVHGRGGFAVVAREDARLVRARAPGENPAPVGPHFRRRAAWREDWYVITEEECATEAIGGGPGGRGDAVILLEAERRGREEREDRCPSITSNAASLPSGRRWRTAVPQR